MTETSAQIATATQTCKMPGCPNDADQTSGIYAALCTMHAREKRANRVTTPQSSGGGLSEIDITNATLDQILKLMPKAVKDLHRAQQKADKANRELKAAKRRWNEIVARASV